MSGSQKVGKRNRKSPSGRPRIARRSSAFESSPTTSREVRYALTALVSSRAIELADSSDSAATGPGPCWTAERTMKLAEDVYRGAAKAMK